MTNLEKLKQDHPELSDFELGLTVGTKCPEDFGYTEDETTHCTFDDESCTKCWSQQYIEKFKKNDTLKEDIDNAALTREVIDQIADKFNEIPTINPMSPKELEAALKIGAIEKEINNLEQGASANTDKPTILDSGNRTEFSSGAVRDMREGKGRCDLMPLDVAEKIIQSPTIGLISAFQKTGDTKYLYFALERFAVNCYMTNENTDTISGTSCTMLLEVAKHFEEGAKKYGESNWQKGIPVHCYIDSAVRHYLKWKRGDNDEPHSKAFVWNLMCCIWEVDHHDYGEVKEES